MLVVIVPGYWSFGSVWVSLGILYLQVKILLVDGLVFFLVKANIARNLLFKQFGLYGPIETE